MHKTYHITLKIALVFVIVMITNRTMATDVYLENKYGATIKYKFDQSATEYQLANNTRSAELGSAYNLRSQGLYIRTTGKGSGYGLSPYTNLDTYLTRIIEEEKYHPNSDAIITIGSSYLQWDITINWEVNSLLQSQIFSSGPDEASLLALKSGPERLTAIKNGILGITYAQKARDISEADYSVATKKGLINLNDRLLKALVAAPYKQVPLNPKITYHGQPNIDPDIDEIKTNIDQIHRSLESYRAKGNAK